MPWLPIVMLIVFTSIVMLLTSKSSVKIHERFEDAVCTFLPKTTGMLETSPPDCLPATNIRVEDLQAKPFTKPDGRSLTNVQLNLIKDSLPYECWTPSKDETRGFMVFNKFVDVCTKLWMCCEAHANYKNDQRWLNLKQQWPSVVLISEKTNTSPYASTYWVDNITCIVFFVDQDANNINTDAFENASWNSVFLHELAHTSERTHGFVWRGAWLFFARILTSHLRLPVLFTCGDCRMYGVCDTTLCPYCKWIKESENHLHCLGMPKDKVWLSYGK